MIARAVVVIVMVIKMMLKMVIREVIVIIMKGKMVVSLSIKLDKYMSFFTHEFFGWGNFFNHFY